MSTDTEAPAEKAPKKIKEKHDCLCASFEVVDPQDPQNSIFSTGCDQQTYGTFAQGHDARLVSFLVDGIKDGYYIQQLKDGQPVRFNTPAEAVAQASDALRGKAEKATENMRAKLAAKQELASKKAEAKANREALAAKKKAEKEAAAAAKAKGPKQTGAEVVAGSGEGDGTPLAEGQVKIKVGRFEYNAMVDEDGTATYVDGAGATQTVERDGYRLLEPVTA